MVSPIDLNEHDEQAAAAQANMFRAHAAALHTLLGDDNDDEANPQQDEEEILTVVQSRIEHVNLTQDFIREISAATLENGNLGADVIEHLRNPEEGPADISDPNIRLALDLFMACEKSPQNTYSSVCKALLCRYPETELLSYHSVKKLIAEITGVVAVSINSGHADAIIMLLPVEIAQITPIHKGYKINWTS